MKLGERKYRNLKRIKEKIIESIKKKEKQKKDREERRQKALERRDLMVNINLISVEIIIV